CASTRPPAVGCNPFGVKTGVERPRPMTDLEPGTLRLLSAGLCTLVVDAGRPRTRSLGVPVGGAADRVAWAVGNALLDNPPDAAALEVRLAGPSLRADADLACVVVGAPFDVDVD